jgi:quercetin dioxygenase-like cupin family protein
MSKPLIKSFSESFPQAVPVRLEDLVSYSDDAVVSRTIAKSEAGTLTLFAFDKDQGLSEHTAPFDAFVQIPEGKCKLTIGGKSITLEPGESALMPAGIPHAVFAETPMKMVLFMLKK